MEVPEGPKALVSLMPHYGSFSSAAVHDMGLPIKAKKKVSRDPGEVSLEDAILAYLKGFGL